MQQQQILNVYKYTFISFPIPPSRSLYTNKWPAPAQCGIRIRKNLNWKFVSVHFVLFHHYYTKHPAFCKYLEASTIPQKSTSWYTHSFTCLLAILLRFVKTWCEGVEWCLSKWKTNISFSLFTKNKLFKRQQKEEEEECSSRRFGVCFSLCILLWFF